MADNQLADTWERFCKTRDPALRERLILHHAPLVKWVVARLGMTGSATLDYQDLLSHGVTGLIEAVDRYDPARGVTFETYASQRIRGAVLDALRSLDYVSRGVRQRMSEIEQAIHDLRASGKEQPSDEEIAARLDISLESYQKVLEQANVVFLSLDSPLAELGQNGGEGASLGEVLEDSSVGDLLEEIEERELHRALAEAISTLSEREQLVLSLYYNEELTGREVAAVLDLSPSRVSQLLARAIMLLRAQMVYHVDVNTARRQRHGRHKAGAAAVASPVRTHEIG